MKRTIIIAILAGGFLTLPVSCKEGNAASKVKKENLIQAEKRDSQINIGSPIAKFDKEVFDFGKVPEGEIVKTTFTITNDGKSDLIISDATSTCGCTVPEWPKEAIAPGETKEIKVSFNTNGKPNKQSKAVTLTTNTEKGREILKITGMVTPKTIQ
ncbi:DUF1573 domain-containing protein [Tenacibaculum sp. SG-28]|uniref:DUF1573 domain-containing protein n=1 Tax=Tenacibaculum sp. SG-28 TaxID=754426 RepID=UPI000CF3F82C|nr:DUF1573 domain-containing protein [Tenacibaculum sp. SG-28]PQJ20753.1 hypothetical protein BSU00_10715 [Tenacibaculum sp. SG-28]